MHTHNDCNVAYQPHDHAQCIHDALGTAKQLCEQQGAKLTHLREEVFTLIWQSHKPLGAYDILNALSKKTGRDKAAPPTVYRALDFLQAQGLVHRIASLNAYMGCCHPEQAHRSEFLICRSCGIAIENHHNTTDIANTHGFAIEKVSIEAIGLCPACQKGSHA